MIAEIICKKIKKTLSHCDMHPKSQTLLEVHIFYRKKFFIFLVMAKLTLTAVFIEK